MRRTEDGYVQGDLEAYCSRLLAECDRPPSVSGAVKDPTIARAQEREVRSRTGYRRRPEPMSSMALVESLIASPEGTFSEVPRLSGDEARALRARRERGSGQSWNVW